MKSSPVAREEKTVTGWGKGGGMRGRGAREEGDATGPGGDVKARTAGAMMPKIERRVGIRRNWAKGWRL